MTTFANEEKSVQFVMRLGPTEKAMLAQLAKDGGSSGAETVRQLIRNAYIGTYGMKRPTTRRRP